MHRKNFPKRHAQRHLEAEQRQEKRNQRSPQEQISSLKHRRGESKREITRLEKLLK